MKTTCVGVAVVIGGVLLAQTAERRARVISSMAARPRCVASVRPATLPLIVALLSITLKAPKMTTMPMIMAVSSSMRLKPSSAPRPISMSRGLVVMERHRHGDAAGHDVVHGGDGACGGFAFLVAQTL